MNTLSSRPTHPDRWVGVVLFALMLWLSGSLLMDFVVMPGLFVSGMLSQPDFAPAGYTLFWIFNRLELLCAGVILTGLLATRQRRTEADTLVSGLRSRWAMELGVGLLAVSLVITYALAPAMAALGTSLDPFAVSAEVPAAMDRMHGVYFALDTLKVVGCGSLLGLIYRDLSRG